MALKRNTEKSTEVAIGQQAVAQTDEMPRGYDTLLESIKERVRTAQVKAALAVNRELVELYWDVGRLIVERQQAEGWGASTVNRLARDMQTEFPGITGFSAGNVRRMRAFYRAWSDPISAQAARKLEPVPESAQAARELEIATLPQTVAEIPWFHNIVLIEKLDNPDERLWYAQKTTENGWSRAVLVHQIESGLYQRQGAAISNFHNTLPAPQSDLAQQLLKDPYTFEFLGMSERMQERDLESGMRTRKGIDRPVLCAGQLVSEYEFRVQPERGYLMAPIHLNPSQPVSIGINRYQLVSPGLNRYQQATCRGAILG